MAIASLVLVSLLITTGIAFALGMGAVNQGKGGSTGEGGSVSDKSSIGYFNMH
jgi:hypothetical protein